MSAVILLDVNQRAQVGELLDRIAVSRSTCAACHRLIWFLKGKNGELFIYDDDASQHARDCVSPLKRRRQA